MGYSPWDHKELDMSETAEHTHMPFYLPHQATQFWHLQKDLCNPLGHRSESALVAVSGPSGSGKRTKNPKWHLPLGEALHIQLVPEKAGCQVVPYSSLRFHLNIIPN